jgi:hypothetical protein
VGSYRAVSIKLWGFKWIKKMTYPGATIETFIVSPIEYITPVKKRLKTPENGSVLI